MIFTRLLLITLTVILLSSGIQGKKKEELDDELSEILECLESTPLGDVLKGLLERFGKRFVNLVMTGLGVSNLFMERLEEVSPKLADFYSDRVADFISLFNDVADEVKKTGLFGKS